MRQFESTNLMKRNEIFNEYHVYFIDSYSTKFNDVSLVHLYVADKKILLNKYVKIISNTENYIVFEFNYDGLPRQLKGFKTKEAAQLQIDTK